MHSSCSPWTTGFLRDVVDKLSPGRLPIFGTGFSNGSFTISLIALKMPGWLTAIAPLAGHTYEDLDKLPALPALLIWGTEDKKVRPTGCCRDPTMAECCCEISEQSLQKCVSDDMLGKAWIEANGCNQSTVRQLALGDHKTGSCMEAVGGAHQVTICLLPGISNAEIP